MSWQLLILLSVLTYSVSVLLQRILVREDKSDPIAFSIVFTMGVSVMIAVYGLLVHSISFPDIHRVWFGLIMTTVLYGLGGVFLYTSLKHIEASKFTIIFSSRVLFTVLASSVLLSEGLGAPQWIGALFIFAGTVLVTGKIRNFKRDRSELYAVLAAMCFGFAVTNDRVLLKSFSLYPYVFLTFFLPALFELIIWPKSVSNMHIFLGKKTLPKILLLCFIYAVSALLFFAALQKAPNSSQVATINLTSIVVIVLLAIIFLKERTDWVKKVIGAALSFVGLLLIS